MYLFRTPTPMHLDHIYCMRILSSLFVCVLIIVQHTVCPLLFMGFNVCGFHRLAVICKSFVCENFDVNRYAQSNDQHPTWNPQNVNPAKIKVHMVLHLVSPLGDSPSNIQEESTTDVPPPRYAGFRIAAVYENSTVGTGEPRPPPEGSGFGVWPLLYTYLCIGRSLQPL